MKAAPEGVAMATNSERNSRTLKKDDLAEWMFDPAPRFDDAERDLARLDIGWAKAALSLRTRGEWRFGHGNSQRTASLLQVFEWLEAHRERVLGGNTLAILHGVSLCAEENVPLPTWLAGAFRDAMQRLSDLDGPTSLEGVFCDPTKGARTRRKAADEKQDFHLGGQLWFAAWNLAVADESISSIDALIDVVLSKRNYGIGKTKARALILKTEDDQRQLRRDPPSKHLSQFLAKRRKR